MEDMKNIQWFPGHMAKTRRLIKSNLPLVDAVVEILDARTPLSSRNPEMDRLTAGKPRMVILNKSDLADEKITEKWLAYFRSQNITAISADCKSGKGVKNFIPAVKNQLLKSLLQKYEEKGIKGKPLRLMIVGIPNVGKSSFINRMAGSKKAKAEDRPGVTRDKQWVKIGTGVEMLDMPGVLWPKFDDQNVACRLAFTGAIKDDILDIETLASRLLKFLSENYPEKLRERYKIDFDDFDEGYILLEKTGRKRGMLVSGGEVNTERIAITVIDEFRAGKLGRITLELPEDNKND
ncbi:MAG: ribosome biogenesis GTPase YlqF [Oscillospiraceae bacterium]|nr:ribosome biogenesis GTPase YlqF [Oscillospiraceae bacterium]